MHKPVEPFIKLNITWALLLLTHLKKVALSIMKSYINPKVLQYKEISFNVALSTTSKTRMPCINWIYTLQNAINAIKVFPSGVAADGFSIDFYKAYSDSVALKTNTVIINSEYLFHFEKSGWEDQSDHPVSLLPFLALDKQNLSQKTEQIHLNYYITKQRLHYQEGFFFYFTVQR